MPFTAKHKFASTKPDGVDPLLVQPSNWNDGHDLQSGALTLLGNPNAVAGPVVEVPYADFMTSLGLAGANKIINGDFSVSQRNGVNNAITPLTAPAWVADRWSLGISQANKLSFTATQSFGANPLSTYLYLVSNSAYALLPGDAFIMYQKVENLNCTDLKWGNSAGVGQPITLSFYAFSGNNPGTYSGAIRNDSGANYRSYPFTFALPVAATWYKITITIPADDIASPGTYWGNTPAYLVLIFNLGSQASQLSPTPNVWQNGNFYGVQGTISLVSTNGATLYMTAAKLETGSVATPFVSDSASENLAKCQRYYWRTGKRTQYQYYNATGQMTSSVNALIAMTGAVQMRTTPTLSYTGSIQAQSAARGWSLASFGLNNNSPGPDFLMDMQFTAGAGMNPGDGVTMQEGSAIAGGAAITFDAEL